MLTRALTRTDNLTVDDTYLSDSDYSEIHELLEDGDAGTKSKPASIKGTSCDGVTQKRAKKQKRRLWSEDEDRLLRRTVSHVKSHCESRDKSTSGRLRDKSTSGRLPWLEIARLIEGRSAKQCRDRWGSIDNHPTRSWTAKEDNQLLELHKRFSNRWVKIASFFEDRNDNMVKSRFRALNKQGLATKKIVSESKREIASQVTVAQQHETKSAPVLGPLEKVANGSSKRTRAESAPILPTQVSGMGESNDKPLTKRMRVSSGQDLSLYEFPDIEYTVTTVKEDNLNAKVAQPPLWYSEFGAISQPRIGPSQPFEIRAQAPVVTPAMAPVTGQPRGWQENDSDWIDFLLEHVVAKPQALY